MSAGHHYVFFGKISYSDLLPIFSIMLGEGLFDVEFMSSLYILDINVLSGKPFAIIFSHS